MQFRVMTEPQEGASYDDLLRVALETERLGYDGFFRSDHLMRTAEGDGSPGPTDAWVTLGGLARDTERIRLGTLMSSATFRLPGPLAIAVATADAMSGGRIELGIGGGWYEAEHRGYGIPFPAVGERFDRLEEQLRIITGLWETSEGSVYSFEGKYYSLSDSPALPKPVQRPRPPIIVGGKGPRRTPALAARYADEFNLPFDTLDATMTQFDRVRAACEAEDRDPSSLVLSAAQTICVGESPADLERRAASIGAPLESLREGGLAGRPEEVVDKVGRLGELGATRVYLQLLDLDDLDQLRLIADRVVPSLP